MLGLSRDANVRPWRVVKSFSSCRSQDMCSELCIVQYMPMLEITASREREFSHGRHPSARVSIVRSADEPGWLFGDGMRSATMSDDYSDVFDVAVVLACTDSVYEMFSVLNSFDTYTPRHARSGDDGFPHRGFPMQRALTVVETTVPAIPSGTWALILNRDNANPVRSDLLCGVAEICGTLSYS
jgi:hypothetical protein